jgi:hypothetical protein
MLMLLGRRKVKIRVIMLHNTEPRYDTMTFTCLTSIVITSYSLYIITYLTYITIRSMMYSTYKG